MKIHPTASIDPTAEVGEDVEIGAYSVIGANVVIGDRTRVHSQVVIEQYVTIGTDCEVFPGAVLGGIPQDRKFKGEKSFLVIGNNNIIREHVTMHRAAGAGNETRIGDNNLIMAYGHIGQRARGRPRRSRRDSRRASVCTHRASRNGWGILQSRSGCSTLHDGGWQAKQGSGS